jgi:S1-C subfamily serine protease
MLRYVLVILIMTVSGLLAQWPESIADLQKSMCLVEFYQPQYEIREIKDDARIKIKITGILVNTDGLILTSDIIFPAKLDIVSQNRFYNAGQSKPEDITVIFDTDNKFEAELVGIDEEYRVAFIQIKQPENLPDPVEFNKINEPVIGDKFYLIQYMNERYNLENIVTGHNINAIIEKPFRKLLTTTSFSPLSAGGLAINDEGEPAGIIFRTSDHVRSYDYDMDFSGNRSFITPVLPGTYLTDLIKDPPRIQKQKNGTGKSWLGIRMQILKQEMAEYWEIPGTHGIIINSVVPQSPGEKAGLQVGDIITGINDFRIQGAEDQDLELTRNYIRSLPEGEAILFFIRGKKTHNIPVTLENAPISKYFSEEHAEEFLRFSIKELTKDIILENDLDFDIEGVWVSRVEEAGAASLSGLMVHDLILTINDQKVGSVDEFKKLLVPITKNKPGYVQLFLRRGNRTLFVFVKTLHENNGSSEG